MNYSELLKKGAKELSIASQSPNLDSRVFLSHITGKDESYFHAYSEKVVPKDQIIEFLACIKRRKLGEPLAYITGSKGFWKDSFFVNKCVLIPRPETELIIEKSIEHVKNPKNILDLGTGSGCLALSLKEEFPNAKVCGVDISDKALSLAQKNAKNLRRDVDFIKFDMMSEDWRGLGNFDLVVSNPPYLACDETPDNSFEPKQALFAGQSGLVFYKQISKKVSEILNPKGFVFLEVGHTQSRAVGELFSGHVRIFKDLADIERIVAVEY